MKFSSVIAAASFAASANAALSQTDLQVLDIILKDIKNNLTDYLALIGAGKLDLPDNIYQLAHKARTYTDQSYTTLIPPDFDMAEVTHLILELPWYSSRLVPLLAPLTGTVTAEKPSSSAAPAPSSSAAPAAPSSSAAPAAPSSSAAPVESAKPSVAVSSAPAPPPVATKPVEGAAAHIEVGVAAALAGVVGLLL